MRTNKKRRVAIALALATSAVLTGCGSNSSSAPVLPGGVVGVNGITGGCIPISQPIVFTATGMGMNGGGSFAAGQIPYSTPYGTVGIGTGTSLLTTGTSTYIDTVTPSPSAPYGEASGTLELSFSSYLGGGYQSGYGSYNGLNAGTGASTMSGYMQLSNLAQESIASDPNLEYYLGSSAYGSTYGSTYGTNSIYGSQYGSQYGYNQSALCVSGIAIQGYLYSQQLAEGGFQATVWLYLNNTTHGYILNWY